MKETTNPTMTSTNKYTKKAAKHKCLAAKDLPKWAGVELNHRHTDFQSESAVCKYL